jgi:type I restriction-modification system DNA methylase subunit
MIIAGHQPEYLPYIGLICKALKADAFVLVDHVQYGKKQFQNRNRIRTSNGPDGWSWLTVPVITHGRFDQQIKDVEINNNSDWNKKHLKSIKYSYQGAPFFKEYFSLFEEVYSKKWVKLADLNEAIIKVIFKILDADVKIIKSSDYDIRGEKTEMLIDMCKKMGATGYLSGMGAKTLYHIDEEMFKAAGLSHSYCNFKHPVYRQRFSPFVPNMSVIDLLFNCGPESKKIITDSGL